MTKQAIGRILPVIVDEEALLPAHAVEQEETKNGPKTVVPVSYKAAYRAKAAAEGRTSKAAKRSNGDWLAQELEAECVTKTGFDFDRFVAILAANGIDGLKRWPNRNNGWQGRFRMSGAIVLRGVVGKSGWFHTPEGSVDLNQVAEAAAFLAKHAG